MWESIGCFCFYYVKNNNSPFTERNEIYCFMFRIPWGNPIEVTRLFKSFAENFKTIKNSESSRTTRTPTVSIIKYLQSLCFYVAYNLIRKLEQQSVSLSCLESINLSVFQPLKSLLDKVFSISCNDHCQKNIFQKKISGNF